MTNNNTHQAATLDVLVRGHRTQRERRVLLARDGELMGALRGRAWVCREGSG